MIDYKENPDDSDNPCESRANKVCVADSDDLFVNEINYDHIFYEISNQLNTKNYDIINETICALRTFDKNDIYFQSFIKYQIPKLLSDLIIENSFEINFKSLFDLILEVLIETNDSKTI